MDKSLNYVLFENYCSHRPLVGLKFQINELIKLNEYQRSRSLFDLEQRSLRFRFQNKILFFSESVESFGTKFHMKADG